MLALLLAVLLAQVESGQAPAGEAGRLAASDPKVVLEIDAGRLKGGPIRLAWSDDGSFFLRSAQMDIYQNELARNFLLPASGGAPVQVDQEPPWAAQYWTWKSGYSAPGLPSLRFDIETRQENKTATGSTGQDFGGAGGGTANPNRSDPTSNQIAKDLGSMQRITTTTIRLKGRLVEEAQNRRLVPGVNFGWAPAPIAALAFVNPKKHLAVVDREGRTFEVEGTRDVLLPAWSPDGRKIAFLQKIDRKKYALTVVDIIRN